MKERSQRHGFGPLSGCLVLVLMALVACATHPGRKSPLLPTDLDAMGVVLGSLTSQRMVGILGSMESYGGHELTITDIQTGKHYTYTGAGYFQWILAPGEYALTRIGLAGKDLVPKFTPFRFTVEAGTIKYLGSLVTDRDVSDGNFSSRKAYVLVNKKGPGEARKQQAPQKVRAREIRLYIVNAKSVVEASFRRRNPALSLQPVVEDPMR